MERNRPQTGKKLVAILVSGALTLGLAGAATAQNHDHAAPQAKVVDDLGFLPVENANDAAATEIKLPPGFKARAIIKPGDRTADGTYPSNPDMNVIDPSGRFLFTAHEIFDPAEAAKSGSLTRTDLQTGVTVILVSGLRAADGLKWTPWGTLLLGEEYTSGSVWEVDPWSGKAQQRILLGTFSHEGIAIAKNGTVYLADEDKQGDIYKFVPKNPLTVNSLTEGTLYAMKAGEGWIKIDDPADARNEAIKKGASTFNRPEDIEIDAGGKIYNTITGEHRVIVIDDTGDKPVVKDFVKAGANISAEDFNWPDNIAFDARGNLFILEDVPGKEMKAKNRLDDVWVALPDRSGDGLSDGVYRFAAWAPVGVEPSGATFSPDGTKMYINSLEGGDNYQDGTVWEITGFRGRGHDEDKK